MNLNFRNRFVRDWKGKTKCKEKKAKGKGAKFYLLCIIIYLIKR